MIKATILHCKLYTGTGTTWADEMNFVMYHAPGVVSISRPVDQETSALPLQTPYYILIIYISMYVYNYIYVTSTVYISSLILFICLLLLLA